MSGDRRPRIPPALGARLLRSLPRASQLEALARDVLNRVQLEASTTHRGRLTAALFWSAECECEMICDGDHAWIAVDLCLLHLVTLANRLYMGSVQPHELRRKLRALVGQECILRGDYSVAIHIADGGSPDFEHELGAGQSLLAMQIEYIVRHEYYHYRMAADPAFKEAALEDYVERLVPVMAGFFPLPRLYSNKGIGEENVATLYHAERDRTRESLGWTLKRAEEEICDILALNDLYDRNLDQAALALVVPVTIAMILLVREEISGAAGIEHFSANTLRLPLPDGRVKELVFNPRYESRVTNASMRSATVAALAERQHEINGLNTLSDEYEKKAISPLVDAIEEFRCALASELDQRQITHVYDTRERARARSVYDLAQEDVQTGCIEFIELLPRMHG